MEQRASGQDGNRFILSERLTVELFLLVYVFIFFLGETTTGTPYIWLLLSLLAGFLSYFIFQKNDFSIIAGIFISLVVTLPLLMCNAPGLNVFLFFVFTLWRIKSNLSGSKIIGWPFLFTNTFALVVFYYLVWMMFPNAQKDVLLEQLAKLYLVTSFLYFFIRMITIWITSKRMGNFQAREAGKVFGFIIILGGVAYLAVYFGMNSVRTGIVAVFSFLFGGLFKAFGMMMAPVIDGIREWGQKNIDEYGEDSEYVDFKRLEESSLIGVSDSFFEIFMFSAAIIFLLVALVLIIRKKRQITDKKKVFDYSLSSMGRKKSREKDSQLVYDYSAAKDEIRKTFESFESEAQTKDMSRLRGETVSEWFSRMGWGYNEPLFNIYNNVRYGSHPPTETEYRLFLSEIENIKEKYFKKDV
ncbi:multisubunit Na+/H+ antiporter MnhG subunit [Sporosarcina luteola]|nr:multisubunit Na+/H+ antiporter MnhG subunit [Sporosarcina luteola]